MKLQRLITALTVLLSLLIHLGIYLGAQLLPTPVRVLPGLPVEIIYTNNDEDQNSRQVVSDPDLGKIVKKAQDQARLLSKLTRRVEEEMVAANKGPSQNRPPGTTLSTTQREAQPKPEKSIEPFKPDGNLGFRQNKNLRLPENPEQQTIGKNLVFGGSTSGEYIPFVKEGSFTSLNTDQFLYYTFFNRVNDQIRSRWVGGVRGFAATLSHQDIQRLSKVQRQTEIEVVLQPDGYLKTVLVNRSSGEPGLDEAAVVAFKKAAPLLNPPTEMKGDDGMIHLHYSFVIQWQPNYLVRKAE